MSTLDSVDTDPSRSQGAPLPTRKIALGEELPIFCEKCGYALHGLPQTVCPHCTIRQFHCPECGHHQPINTLRPAVQKILGRVRSMLLAMLVLFKLNFFGWILFAWYVGGYEVANEQHRTYPYNNVRGAQIVAEGIPPEAMLTISLMGVIFGMVGRMLLLRWRRGYVVGAVLGALVVVAMASGAWWWQNGREKYDRVGSPFGVDFVSLLVLVGISVTLGASVVWGVWVAVTHVFLPKRTSQALLEYQRSLSNPAAAALARD